VQADPAAGVKLRRCAGCYTVRFCSSACQRADWSQHKLVCESFGAARKKEAGLMLNAVVLEDEGLVGGFCRRARMWTVRSTMGERR